MPAGRPSQPPRFAGESFAGERPKRVLQEKPIPALERLPKFTKSTPSQTCMICEVQFTISAKKSLKDVRYFKLNADLTRQMPRSVVQHRFSGVIVFNSQSFWL